jgi:acyl carrier protein
VQIDGGINADTPLIESGQFDSLALFNLVVWIEQQIGATIDPTSVDVAAEWNSVNDILSFIERQRGR